MLQVHRTYRTRKASRKFFIHATKNKPASNGCNFIGEDVKTGVIAFFDYKGKHAWDEALNLECDPYTWCGLLDGEKFSNKTFVRKEELKFTYSHYLRMENRNPTTVTCIDRAGFELTYI
jgi:hypothetical protein